MAANPASAYRAFHDVEIAFPRREAKAVPRVQARTRHADIADPLDPARGILFGLLLCVPFWVVVYLMLF